MSNTNTIQRIRVGLELYGMTQERFLSYLKSNQIRDIYQIWSVNWRQVVRTYDNPEQNKNQEVKSLLQQINKRYKEYEEYRIRHVDPGKYAWTARAEGDFLFLFERLERPWKFKKEHAFYTICHPYSASFNEYSIWFRALKPEELPKAMQVCKRETRKLGIREKPWKLPFTWNDCQQAYRKRIRNSFTGLGVGKNYDIAIVIAENILSTWDEYKKEWQPWNNAWSKLAHQKLSITFDDIPMRPGYTATFRNGRIQISRYERSRTWGFEDIVQFVFRETLAADKKAAWILAVAFTVGGERAARLINGFHEQHNLRKWWETK